MVDPPKKISLSERVSDWVSALTIAIAGLVGLADFLGFTTALPWLAGKTSAIALVVICGLTLVVFLDRRTKLSNVQQSIESALALLRAERAPNVRVVRSREEHFLVMIAMLQSAPKGATLLASHVEWSKLPFLGAESAEEKEFNKVWYTRIARNELHTRHVVLAHALDRVQGIRHRLNNEYKKARQYSLSVIIASDPPFPLIDLVIVKETGESLFTYSTDPKQPGIMNRAIFIRDRQVTDSLAECFNVLWQKAIPVKTYDSIDWSALDKLEQALASKANTHLPAH